MTGSSREIGLATGITFLAAGARVVFASERPPSDCVELAPYLEKRSVRYLQADLSNTQQATGLVRKWWNV